jgi:hypothetical protein
MASTRIVIAALPILMLPSAVAAHQPRIVDRSPDESPASFLFSPFGWGMVLIVFVLAFAFGFILRLAVRRFGRHTARGARTNIGVKGRLLRFAIGIGLFVWAITTSWSPIILFCGGFAFFESVFSWCGLYAAVGKNTCPVA